MYRGIAQLLSVRWEYDDASRVKSQAWQMGQQSYEETYTYSATDGNLTGITRSGGGNSLQLSYDSLSRLASAGNGVYTRNYTYRDISSTQTTTQVQSLGYTGLSGALSGLTYNYTYNALGNIASVAKGSGTATTYTYDSMGQLTGANLPGLTCAYTYDGAGNLLTASDGTTTNTYTYGNASWKDLLTAFNGEKIVYEGQTLDENGSVTGTPTSGNPTSYFNGTRWNLGWAEGRSLREAASGTPEQDTALNFAYDVSGLRTEKQVTRTVYEMTTEHTYAATVVAPTCTEGGYTLHECSCGDSYQDTETAALGHDYTSSGEGTLTCTRCGDTIAHTHNYTVTVVPPTCTTGGYTLHECSCGDSYQDAATPALGHNFRNDPTTGGQKCRRCGYIEMPIEIPTSHGELMSLEEPTEPEVPLQNEPDEPADDTPETPDTPPTENAPLHRGEATEITETHQYIYTGGKLLRETISDGTTTKTLDFTYDNVGMPYSLTYNNGTTTATYYYITNLQGDVMYLVDANGNEVAAYDYDPYGKVITATGAMAEVNPLRYRGYYYDSETGFYYLQSRYYDPEICRFINADSYTSTGVGYLGYNMFAYCNNSPILHSDPSGEILVTTVILIVSAAIGVTVAAVTAYESRKAGCDWADTAFYSIGNGLCAFAAVYSLGMTAYNIYLNFYAINTVASTADNTATIYPPNNGFSGTPETVTLPTGTTVERYGSPNGRYVAPVGTPPEALSLPPDKVGSLPDYYALLSPIEVQTGVAAPWFNQPGGGTQYILPDSITNLVSSGKMILLPY